MWKTIYPQSIYMFVIRNIISLNIHKNQKKKKKNCIGGVYIKRKLI